MPSCPSPATTTCLAHTLLLAYLWMDISPMDSSYSILQKDVVWFIDTTHRSRSANMARHWWRPHLRAPRHLRLRARARCLPTW